MNMWQSLSGMIEVELTSAELPDAMTAINALGIEISLPQWKDELTCRFRVRRESYRTLRNWAERRGESLRIRRRLGWYWRAEAYFHRPVLVFGFLFFFVLSMALSGRILFVRVEGNAQIPDRLILQAAEAEGVAFGANRRKLRSEQMKNGILSAIPELQWAGVNTAGCVATVSVRERAQVKDTDPPGLITRIVAARDGYILSGTVLQGTGMFAPGQTVHQGQTLISGYVDCDFCIRGVRAEGEILAQTNREIMAVTPVKHLLRVDSKGVKRKISLLFRKKRINLWKDSGISDVTCDRMYAEYYITLPGGYQLPIALCVEKYILWDTSLSEDPSEMIRDRLEDFCGRYLRQQMIAGTVQSGNESFSVEKGRYSLKGHYICREMIGREQQEQIGEENGKND